MEENLDTNESTESTESPNNFGKDLAQSFGIAAATTAGMLTSMIVIPVVVAKLKSVRENHRVKKAAKKASREKK